MAKDPLAPPDYDALVDELKSVRKAGIVKLRGLELPALSRATISSGLAEPGSPVDAPVIERLLVEALERLGGGELEEAAAKLFGLEPGTRGRKPSDLRDMAATVYERNRDTFRLNYEPTVVSQVAEAILGLAHDFRLRLSRLNLERRAPTSTRLAVEWVERFEAYYRMWTPISALTGDLEAYYTTLDEIDAPAWWEPEDDDDAWDPLREAEGYARFALFHFASLLGERERFVRRFGGLWLVSDQEAEQLISNAVYEIIWWSPFNERDDSYLRRLVADSGEELHEFLSQLATDAIGQDIHAEWQDWVANCTCDERPISAPDCRGHQVIEQGRLYLRLLDDEWAKIADWYRIDPEMVRPTEPERDLYHRLA